MGWGQGKKNKNTKFERSSEKVHSNRLPVILTPYRLRMVEKITNSFNYLAGILAMCQCFSS
jgi:hypothetical protein